MVSQYTDVTRLLHAKQIARDHGYFVVAIPFRDKNGDPKTKFLLYREADPRNVYVGKRQTIAALHSFVKKVTGFK